MMAGVRDRTKRSAGHVVAAAVLVSVALLAASLPVVVPALAQAPPSIAAGPTSESEKVPSQAAATQDERYLPCNSGPEALRQIDAWERQGLKASIDELGTPISEESFAERFINDCSQQLALMSAAAGLDRESPLRAVVNAWRTNLEFMKWWLENRRSKAAPQPRVR
jgi:hypothetical protein